MNWMTSGRKRVQRSQKIKELRAKHFARVAADRAKAVPKPIRSSTSRQSADVSRLKTRWIQACHQRQLSSGRASSASPACHDKDRIGNTVRVDSPDGHIVPRKLGIDATSPSMFDLLEIGGSNGEEWMPSTAGVVQGFDARAWPPSQQQKQVMSLIHRPSTADAVRSPCLESTQLAFARESNGEASQVRGVGQEYEGHLLGSECQPRPETATALHTADGTPLFGIRGAITATTSGLDSAEGTSGISGCSDQIRMMGKDNPMRFFDSGIEVALDGSPVSSSTTRYPQLMDTPTARSRASSSGSEMRNFASPGISQPEKGGLPKFRKNASHGGDTPPQVQLFASRDGVGNASHDNPTCGEKPCLASPLVKATYTDIEKQTDIECHQSTPDEGYVSVVDRHGPPRKSPPSPEESPAFKALARNWGLFGGALDSPFVQNAVGITTENSNPPGAALHTDCTAWEECCQTDSPLGHPCRNDARLSIKRSPLQVEPNQSTRHERGQATASDASSDASTEMSTARNDSPELVMRWETSEPSPDVDASCARMAQPNQAMAADYSDRLAAHQSFPSGAGNTPGYDLDSHLEVPASSAEISEASAGPPTALATNRKESARTVDGTARVVARSEKPNKELKHTPPGEYSGGSSGETSQRSRDTTEIETTEAQSRGTGTTDHSQPEAVPGGEKLEGGRERQEGSSKRSPSLKGFEEYGHRFKRSAGDSPRTKHKKTFDSEVQTPEVAKARLGSLCSSIPREVESPQIGTTCQRHGRREEVPMETRSDGLASEYASQILLEGKTTPTRLLDRSSRMLSDSLVRDVGGTGDHYAAFGRMGGRGGKNICTRGLGGEIETDDYSTIVWYRTIVACLMAE